MPLANPFWSEKTQEAMKISAARPSDLPRVPTDDELEDYVEPLQQGTGAEKRQWSRPRGHHVATRSGPSSGERFVTPAMSLQAPSSWIHAEESIAAMGKKRKDRFLLAQWMVGATVFQMARVAWKMSWASSCLSSSFSAPHAIGGNEKEI